MQKTNFIKIFFIGLLTLFIYSQGNAQCNYTFRAVDSYGDGWVCCGCTSNTVTVQVNGVDVPGLVGYTLAAATEDVTIPGVNTGDVITIEATFGSLGSPCYTIEASASVVDPFGNITPVTITADATETTTLTATCPACIVPIATFTVVEDCANGFTVDVDVTSLGDAAAVDITDGTTTLATAVGVGVTSVGPFTNGTAVDLTVVHDTDATCNVTQTGLVNATLCPTTVTCGTPTADTYCYTNNDLASWLYTSSDGTSSLQLTFTEGFLENCCDVLTIYDGTDNTGAVLFVSTDGAFVGNDLTAITVSSTGANIFMDFDSDGSVDCAADANGPWNWTVDCLSCTPAAGTAAVGTCDETASTFMIDVDVTNLGDGTVNITNDAGVAATTGVAATGVTSVGPFPFGTVTITLEHPTDATCNIVLPAITLANCPPANDDCANATPITVSSSGSCPGTVPFTTEGATESVVASCEFGGDVDVWYSFTSPGTELVFESTTGLPGIQLFDACGGTEVGACLNNFSGTITGLTAGTAYLAMIWTDGGGGSTGEFCLYERNCTQPAFTVADGGNNCPTDEFFIDVDVTDLGTAAAVNIINDGSAVAVNGVGLGVQTIGPFAGGTTVVVTVEDAADATCLVTNTFTAINCPVMETVTCGTTSTGTHCYTNNDVETWTYTSSDGVSSLNLSFLAGGIESCCDDIVVYDGTDNTGIVLFSGNNGGDLAGLSVTSIGSSIFMEVASDGSVSCASASSCCATQWDWTVDCVSCTPAAGTAAVGTCDETASTFMIDVDVTNLGDGTINITNDAGVAATTGVAATGVTSVGPFPFGTVTITLEHPTDATCNFILPAITLASCPPANDECAGAVAIACGSTTTGTNLGATANGVTCGVAGDQLGVWYSFAGTGDEITVIVNADPSSTAADIGDSKLAVYSGDCTTLVCVDGNDDATPPGGAGSLVTFTSVAGTDYYFYVDGFGVGNVGDFEISVACVTPCNAAGGTISTTDMTTVCVGDGTADEVTATLDGTEVGTTQEWIVTDAAGAVLAYPATFPFDFDGAPAGVCNIYSISYDNVTGLAVGANVNTDLTGCFALSNAIAVTRNEAPAATTTSTDETCTTNDGTATVVATGGDGTYTYAWDDAGLQTTATAMNLPAGTYNVVVTDGNGCTTMAMATVADGCTAGDPCVDGYEVANQLTGALDVNADYETDQGIDSDQVIGGINAAIGVDYDAAIDIDLLPGFEVKLGVEFDAFIDGCQGGTDDGTGGNQ